MEQIAKISWGERLNHVLANHKDLLYIIGILVVTVISFWPTFFNDFQMRWDDQWQVINDYTTGGFSKENVRNILLSVYQGQYSPLDQFLYTLLYKFSGYNPFVFHSASLLFHLANVVLVYWILAKILERYSKMTSNRCQMITLFATLLFAVHPLQVETVAWVSASKILLCTFFYLFATFFFLQFIHEKRIMSYVSAIICFLFSYMSKEQAVTLPLLLTLVYLFSHQKREKKHMISILTPFFLISILMTIHLLLFVAAYPSVISHNEYPLWQRAFLCIYSIVTYFFKWLIPMNLSWFYQYPMDNSTLLPFWLLPYPLLIFVVGYGLWNHLKSGYIMSAFVFSLVHLLPVIHLMALPRGAVIADRYMYLPLLGLNLIIAYILTSLAKRKKEKKYMYIITLVIITTCVILSYQRTEDWVDSSTLKRERVIDNDNSVN